MKKIFIASLCFAFPALAQAPTVVYGAAATANGATDSYNTAGGRTQPFGKPDSHRSANSV